MATTQKLDTAELLYNAATHMGLAPSWLTNGGLFAVSTAIGERYVYYAKGTLNTQLSGHLARNKRNTRIILERAGLPNIPYTKTTDYGEAEQFLAEHAKIIVKPLNGSNSHDVHIVETAEQLHELTIAGCILEKYIGGKELRYLILNDEVIGVHESRYGESVSETRYLERISYTRDEWDADLERQAKQAARALGLRLAAVDYLITPEGAVYILEVNSSPGMKWFHAPTSGPKVDLARLFLETMLEDIYAQARVVPAGRVTATPTVAYSIG